MILDWAQDQERRGDLNALGGLMIDTDLKEELYT